jgi:quinol-cytochrome oxidoreductase complex cytochrome b subunit
VADVAGVGTERRRRRNAHHVTFDKIKPEWYFLDTFVYAVDTFFGIRQDNVGFLVVAC